MILVLLLEERFVGYAETGEQDDDVVVESAVSVWDRIVHHRKGIVLSRGKLLLTFAEMNVFDFRTKIKHQDALTTDVRLPNYSFIKGQKPDLVSSVSRGPLNQLCLPFKGDKDAKPDLIYGRRIWSAVEYDSLVFAELQGELPGY